MILSSLRKVWDIREEFSRHAARDRGPILDELGRLPNVDANNCKNAAEQPLWFEAGPAGILFYSEIDLA